MYISLLVSVSSTLLSAIIAGIPTVGKATEPHLVICRTNIGSMPFILLLSNCNDGVAASILSTNALPPSAISLEMSTNACLSVSSRSMADFEKSLIRIVATVLSSCAP